MSRGDLRTPIFCPSRMPSQTHPSSSKCVTVSFLISQRESPYHTRFSSMTLSMTTLSLCDRSATCRDTPGRRVSWRCMCMGPRVQTCVSESGTQTRATPPPRCPWKSSPPCVPKTHHPKDNALPLVHLNSFLSLFS